MDDHDVEAPWFEWQPSAVPVFFHPTERATSLVEVKQLEQKVYAQSWTRRQRSACWALWRAQGQAVLEDTEHRIGRGGKAVLKLQRPQGLELAAVGKKLFTRSKETPSISPDELGVPREVKQGSWVGLKSSPHGTSGTRSYRHGWFGMIHQNATIRPGMSGSIRSNR
jgi:hypothetical protein